MKKRLTALLCTAALCVSLLMPSAFAAGTTAGEGEALQVLAAMGVMNGDEKGKSRVSVRQCDAGGLYQNGSGSFHLSGYGYVHSPVFHPFRM